MRRIVFNGDYETITATKEYDILPKSYTDGIHDFIFFLDDIGEEIEIKQQYNAPPNDFYEVITCEE